MRPNQAQGHEIPVAGEVEAWRVRTTRASSPGPGARPRPWAAGLSGTVDRSSFDGLGGEAQTGEAWTAPSHSRPGDHANEPPGFRRGHCALARSVAGRSWPVHAAPSGLAAAARSRRPPPGPPPATSSRWAPPSLLLWSVSRGPTPAVLRGLPRLEGGDAVFVEMGFLTDFQTSRERNSENSLPKRS